MADGHTTISAKPAVRIAYAGGRHSMGSLAFSRFSLHDGARFDMRLSAPASAGAGTRAADLPQATATHAIAAVLERRADGALLPFFDPQRGYFEDTVAAITRTLAVAITGETVAEDKYCLAVPIEHMRQRDEASLTPERAQRLMRKNYGRRLGGDGSLETFFDRGDTGHGGRPVRHRAAYAPEHDVRYEQELWAGRITDIFVAPHAEKACSSALSNYAAQGAKVRALDEDAQTVRGFLDMAASALDEERVVQSTLGADGQLQVSSLFTGKARRRPVYGVVMPFEEARHNEDLFIVDAAVEEGSAGAVRYVYVTPRGGTPWPFGVKGWDNGSGRFLGLEVSPSGFWMTTPRKVVGNHMIAGGLKSLYGGRDAEVMRVIVSASTRGDSGQAPSLDQVENFVRRKKYRYEADTVRLGDGGPARLLEVEIERRDRADLWKFVRRLRQEKQGFVHILGGFLTDKPGLAYAGQGQTGDELSRNYF